MNDEMLQSIRDDNLELLKSYIQSGADVNYKPEDLYGNDYYEDGDGISEAALVIASEIAWRRNDTEIVEYLINAGADVNVKDESGNTPLMFAAKTSDIYKSRVKLMQQLIDHGADVNAKNNVNETVLIRVSNLTFQYLV